MPSVLEIFETMEYGPAPEADDLAQGWLERHHRTFGPFIEGAFGVPAPNDALFDTVNPRDGTVLARVKACGDAEVDAAVQAAEKAFPTWSALPGHARARHLYAIARQIQKHSRLFAVLESLDNGKPIRESRDVDVPLVARHFYHHAGWAELRDDRFPGYEPVGVCGQVIAWNFPLLLLSWKVAPALAAGNTVVLKPAEFTPLTALLFAELTAQIGLPPGVFNLVTGDGSTGDKLVRHPGVRKVAFTGSTEVGRAIRRATAGSGKKLSLELGGKSAFLVFDDADLDGAIEGVVDAIWFNQGQVCTAGSRLLIQESVSPQVIRKLKERMENLRVGDPLDKAIDLGAIVAPVQLERITRLVEQGKAEGTECWQPSWAVPTEGWFFPPTLFTDVSPASLLAQTEIFGPVVVAMTFRTPEEAVELANNTPYGLAATVWSENVNLCLDVAPKLKAGVVWVNCTNLFDAAAGFGGYRESGFGREGGAEGMHEYLAPGWWARGLPTGDDAEAAVSLEAGLWADGVLPGANGDGANPADIDRTPKLYVGGKQVRPDSGYSFRVRGSHGQPVGEAGLGNRKDVRNAVEAAHKAGGWSRATAHGRAQVLYYLAENLSARAEGFAARLAALSAPPTRMRRLRFSRRLHASSTTPPGPTNTTARCTVCLSATSRWRCLKRGVCSA